MKFYICTCMRCGYGFYKPVHRSQKVMADFWIKEAIDILRQNGSREPADAVAALTARLATALQRAENAEGALVLAQRALAEAERVLRTIRDKGFDYWRDTAIRADIEAILRAADSAPAVACDHRDCYRSVHRSGAVYWSCGATETAVSASALPGKILPVSGVNGQNNSTSDSAADDQWELCEKHLKIVRPGKCVACEAETVATAHSASVCSAVSCCVEIHGSGTCATCGRTGSTVSGAP